MHTAPSSRTQVKRGARQASYDIATLHAIVDAAYLCHIAFTDERGTHCIPTASWRRGDHLYIHGSNGSRLLQRLVTQECCVTITHLDGLVLARSAFNHAMNYRSAMIYGRFEAVADGTDSRAALDAFMDHIAPGRNADVRAGNAQEFAATTVLRIALLEAACKIRLGPPRDDAGDMDSKAWAGVLPLVQSRGAPVPDADCTAAAPAYVLAWRE